MVILVDQLRSSILGSLTTKRDKGFSLPREHIQREAENSEKLRVSTDMSSDIVQEIGRDAEATNKAKSSTKETSEHETATEHPEQGMEEHWTRTLRVRATATCLGDNPRHPQR